MEEVIRAAVAELPGGVAGILSPADAERLRELPAEKLAAAERRLALLALWVRGDGTVPTADAAIASARLSRGRFFALTKRLREGGTVSLDDLGLYLGRTRRDGQDALAGLAAEASAILASNPAIGTAELVRRLASSAGGASKTTILRVVDRARRTAPPASPFGTDLLFDSASLDLVDASGRLRLFALVDVGTGLLPAWAVRPQGDFAAAYRDIARLAATGEGRWGGGTAPHTGVAASSEARVSVAAPDVVDVRFRRGASGRGVRIVSDARKTGRGLVAALGGEVGGLRLSAGFAPADTTHRSRDRVDLPLAGPLALGRIDRALRDHHASRLPALPPGDGDADALVDGAARALIG